MYVTLAPRTISLGARLRRARSTTLMSAIDSATSTRALAAQPRVQRRTVAAADRELASQGWIAIVRARGARISRDLPELPRIRGAGDLAAGSRSTAGAAISCGSGLARAASASWP